jgi:hydrogenase maturation protease
MLLVIGYGNPLRGDDGVGVHVAHLLGDSGVSPEASILARHQLTLELAEPISRAAGVIFVDASALASPGEIIEQVVEAQTAPGPWTHDASPEGLLSAALELYGHAPPATLIGVGGADFGFGENLSPVVEALVPQIVDRVERRLQEFHTVE